MPELGYGGGAAAQSIEDILAQRAALNEFNRRLAQDEQQKLIAEREAQQRMRTLGLQEREIGDMKAWRESQAALARESEAAAERRHQESVALDKYRADEQARLGAERNRIDEIQARASAASAAAAADQRRRETEREAAATQHFQNLAQERYAKGDYEGGDYYAALAKDPSLASRFGVTDPKTAFTRERELSIVRSDPMGAALAGDQKGGVTVGNEVYDPVGKPGAAPGRKWRSPTQPSIRHDRPDPTLGYPLPRPPAFGPGQLATPEELAAAEKARREEESRALVRQYITQGLR